MKRIDKVLLASFAPLTIFSTSTLLTSCSQEIHYNVFFKTKAMATDIYVVDASTLPTDLVVTLESLQGILAQEKAQIYISHCDKNDPEGLRDEWFNPSVRKYPGIVIHDVDETKIWEFILRYQNKFNNKYVLYTNAVDNNNERDWNKSINLATTIAGVEHYLMISKDLEETAQSHGLTLGADASQMQSHDVFNRYKHRLNNKLLINQSPYDFPLRDYAIASKALTIYLDNETEDFKDTINNWLVDNSVMLGWCMNELNFVADQSAFNLPILAADHCTNLSFFSHYTLKNLKQKYQRPVIKAQPNKHYVAVVMSDGDNLQWLQKDFINSINWYKKTGGYRGQFPVTWTMSPAAYDLNHAVLDYLYGNMTPNDQFIAGPSGYAYANMAQYKDIESYAKITADYMAKCDLNYVNVLDYYDCDYRKFEALMQQKQVKGAVWCNKDLYLSGKGAVDWINGKPIVSMREGLWWNIDKPAEKLEYKWDAVAERIKSYPKDPSIIDGYTIVTANAWQTAGKMGGIKALVDEFSPDDNVEFVTVDQILQLITDNVKHVHAEPQAHAPVPVP